MSRRAGYDIGPPPEVPTAVDFCPATPPRRIGVTIATPEYMDMAVEAVRRWKQYSGLEAIILTSEKGVCWWTKYDLAAMLPGMQVCFFDADIYFVHPLPLDELWPDDCHLTALQDPGVRDPLAFPSEDCKIFGIDPAAYFNGGFWACDFSQPAVQEWMNYARQITLAVKAGEHQRWYDFGEQTALNIAAMRTGIKVRLIDDGWAFFHWAWRHGKLKHPDRILGIHAAGYQGVSGKLEALSRAVAVFTR